MSFRVKIGVAGVIAVVVLTLVLMLLIVKPLGGSAMDQVTDAVRRASQLAQRTQRLAAYELVTQAKDIAIRKDFADALAETEERPRRAAVFDVINELDKELAKENRKPGFFGVIDVKGTIIARDLDPNADHGEKLAYPTAQQVLKTGHAASAVWLMKDRMMRAAVAPIVVDRQIRGAVAIAYGFNAAEAREDQRQFGAHVAYFMNNAIRASSFTVAADDNAEDGAKVGDLTRVLMSRAKQALASGNVSEVLEVEIRGEAYKAITGPLPASVSIVAEQAEPDDDSQPELTQNVGFVVLSSIDQAMTPVRRARLMVLGFGLLMLLTLLGSMAVTARHFVSAEDRLELGVNEVINGNLDYVFDALEEFEGMANALNVMLARLLGRPEPGEEDEGEGAWRTDVIFVEDLASGDADVAGTLATEPQDQYYARLFREYVEARRTASLPVEGITQENLTQKLRANEAMLKAKHKCRAVRFVVNTSGGKVSFKPTRIG